MDSWIITHSISINRFKVGAFNALDMNEAGESNMLKST